MVAMLLPRVDIYLRLFHLLLLQGQPMDCVYFVMSGVVEILRTATADDVERDASGGASLEHSFTVDIDESLMLDCSMPLGMEGMHPLGAVNGRLHIDRMKVRLTWCLLLRKWSTQT